MRRSAAPSQLHSAKRAKFTVPYRSVQSTTPQLCNSDLESTFKAQHDSVPPSDCSESANKNTAIASINKTTSCAGNGAIPLSSPLSPHRMRQAFSPPGFLGRKREPVSTASVDHASQKHSSTKTEETTHLEFKDKVCDIDNPASKTIDADTSFCDSACETDEISANEQKAESQDCEDKGAFESQQLPTDCNVVADAATRTPLKPVNVARKFQSPFVSQRQSVPEGGSSVPITSAAGSDIAGDIAKSGNTQSPGTGLENAVKCLYFSVVWCKLSKKKHKKWEGDAVLVAQGRRVTLYDMDGKDIGKGSGYKSSELESLTDDETLCVGGKEILVMSKLTEEQFKSGKCFAGAGSVCEASCPPPNKPASGQFKSFTNPVLAQTGKTNMNVPAVSRVQNISPRFDPLAPDALVMPRPSAAHQWQHNKQQTAVVDVVVDPHLSYHLRPHQRDGIVFLYECVSAMRNYGGTGAILAFNQLFSTRVKTSNKDDMGLGKTLQCISLIWTLLKQGMYGGKPPVKKVLIITPGSLVKNWSAEFRKWLGPERLQVFAVAADTRVEDYAKTAVYPVLIISYEMFVRGYEVVKKMPFDLVVCDEGHRLKNSAIKTTSLISSLDTQRRVVLSGTPIQNDLQEFFAVVDFCNPGVLGSSSAFRRVYEEPILQSRQPGATKEVVELGDDRAAELSRLTRMFVLRRTQEVNNKYLPPKVELVLFCRPSHLQVEMLREILRTNVVRSCLSGRGFGAGKGAGSPHLLAIAALKQVCNHPKLIAPKVLKAAASLAHGLDAASAGDTLFSGLAGKYDDQLNTDAVRCQDSGKLAALAVILANVFRACPQDKVVLVSNHTKTLDLLQQFCNDCDYKYVRLDGHTPTAQRQQIVTRFNGYGQEKVFLLSSKAGGVGLNLIGASRLFLYDIDWNPANDLQAMARVWRDGQKKEVYIYRLLTTGSLEEKVYQRQISKQGLSGAVMDLKSSDIQFSKEDLKDLFSFSEGTECDTHTLLGCQCLKGGEGGEGDRPTPSLVPVPPAQSCQLGPKPSATQSRNLSMAELLDWQHLRGSSPHCHQGWCLDGTQDFVSFLFWHKANTDK